MRLYVVAGGFLRVAVANTWRSYAGALSPSSRSASATMRRRPRRPAVDALGVDPEQDFDAVPCPRGYLGRLHPGIEPQRQAGVAEVVDPLGER